MNQQEYEKATGIRPVTGLLNEPGKLGYPNDETIDSITPDYSILDDISSYYHYPYENAYFMYSTRGCGMNCGFCAVKTLEPTYIPFISIKEQIKKIDATSLSPKKDLLLSGKAAILYTLCTSSNKGGLSYDSALSRH